MKFGSPHVLGLVIHQTMYLARISTFPFLPDIKQFVQFNSELDGENFDQELESCFRGGR